jgi:hypothetical protein
MTTVIFVLLYIVLVFYLLKFGIDPLLYITVTLWLILSPV